ncbi:MAG TPA: hypothetical protein DCP71_02700 [Verrucomicrobiales bacterium]|nr:hypothetical protein [Verrucomicrobiales bacterium]
MDSNIPETPTLDDLLAEGLGRLQNALGLVDLMSSPERGGFMTLVIMRLEHITLKIDGAANHGRPHFHIEFKQQCSASYAIDTLECLAGSLPRKYSKKIIEWAEEHKDLLYQKWQELHPEGKIFALEREGSSASAAPVTKFKTASNPSYMD